METRSSNVRIRGSGVGTRKGGDRGRTSGRWDAWHWWRGVVEVERLAVDWRIALGLMGWIFVGLLAWGPRREPRGPQGWGYHNKPAALQGWGYHNKPA